MESFDKLKSRLIERKQNGKDSKIQGNSNLIQDELFQLYYKHYCNVRRKNFGQNQLTQQQKDTVALLAYMWYANELSNLIPKTARRENLNSLATISLAGAGLGCVIASVPLNSFLLQAGGLMMDFVAFANTRYKINKGKKQGGSKILSMVDDMVETDQLKYQSRAEKQFESNCATRQSVNYKL